MSDKIKIAVNWASACGGCDVSLLDIEARILDLVAVADVVYWPVAMDFKRSDLAAYGPGEIDIGFFNGAVRTSEQEEDACLLRERCKLLVAYGACAAFGGIPGLANLFQRRDILDRVYRDTPSTENPEDLRPAERCSVDCGELQLPAFHPAVKALHQVVPVDLTIPGCPPTPEVIDDALAAVFAYAEGAAPPPSGTVLASEKALCDDCPRADTRSGTRVPTLKRPHQVLADPERCFLDQGLLCGGLVTRGGCGSVR